MATTIEVRVAASTDDASTRAGAINLTDNFCYLGKDSSYTLSSGYRFLGITIPNGATITTAYIIFTCYYARTGDTVRLKIAGEQNNAAATFSTYADYTGRAKTTALVDWDFTTDWAAESTYNSPEIKTIIQELVNDYGGLSNANIVLLFDDDGSDTSAERYPYSYNGSTTKAALLHIEYTLPTQTISPPGLSQPISYGTPKLSLSIKPPGYQQAIAYGAPTVTVGGAAITIYPPGLQVVIAYGTPALRYPQTISPPGLNVPIAYGTPALIFSGAAVIYIPGHQQPIGYGTPTILKYVFHLILDGRYNIESPETNRLFVIGRDVYGNPVYGQAHDSGESALVGERLDFQQELAIPTEAQAADVASAVLAKMRLGKQRGVILIPYNCGQELWDVVELTDKGANQEAVKYRVVGLRFEYNSRQARYEHRLILGAP